MIRFFGSYRLGWSMVVMLVQRS